MLCSPVVVHPAETWDTRVKFFRLHKMIPKEVTE